METIKCNVEAGYVPVKTMTEGKEFIIVPVVMMVEGVHHGSGGAIYHSKSVLAGAASKWGGHPVTINHPELDGVYVSATTEEIVESYVVGEVIDAYMDEEKLKANIKLDVQRIVAISPYAYEAIMNSEVLEVSIGVRSIDEKVDGEWNGEHYTKVSKIHEPDHLAILPDCQGACSIDDGCGIRVNNLKKMNGNEVNWKKQELTDLVVNEFGFQETMQKLYQSLDAMYSDTTIYWLEEVYENEAVYTKRTRSKNAEGLYGREEQKMYKASYEINEDGSVTWGSPVEVVRKVEYVQINNVKTMCEKCKEKARLLIANQYNSLAENDLEWLGELTEDKLDKFIPINVNKQTTPSEAWDIIKANMSFDDMLNNAPADVKERINLGLQIFNDTKKKLVSEIMANTGDTWTEDELNAFNMQQLEKLHKTSNVTVNKKEDDEPVPVLYIGHGFGASDKNDGVDVKDAAPVLILQ